MFSDGTLNRRDDRIRLQQWKERRENDKVLAAQRDKWSEVKYRQWGKWRRRHAFQSFCPSDACYPDIWHQRFCLSARDTWAFKQGYRQIIRMHTGLTCKHPLQHGKKEQGGWGKRFSPWRKQRVVRLILSSGGWGKRRQYWPLSYPSQVHKRVSAHGDAVPSGATRRAPGFGGDELEGY